MDPADTSNNQPNDQAQDNQGTAIPPAPQDDAGAPPQPTTDGVFPPATDPVDPPAPTDGSLNVEHPAAADGGINQPQEEGAADAPAPVDNPPADDAADGQSNGL